MFNPTSRYYTLDAATFEMSDGSEVSYKRRRFLPRGETLATLVEVTVDDGDRLDMITARTIGNPEQYWRICDAENAMNPPELTREPARKHWRVGDAENGTSSAEPTREPQRRLRVPIPQVNQ